MRRLRHRGIVAGLLAALALWPLHGLAEKGFGDFSAPSEERSRPKPKPPAPLRSKPQPGFHPKPEVRLQSKVKPVVAPTILATPMVRIAAGCFQMGSPPGETGRYDNERRHRVCVEAFELGRHEVTVGEFQRFVSATGYRTDAERDVGGVPGCRAADKDDKEHFYANRSWANWLKPSLDQANRNDHPVTCVSWNDANAYVNWLNRDQGGGWRLPTEAEWEYAARAGTTTSRYWGDAESLACRYENVADKGYNCNGSGFPCDDGYQYVAPVERFEPNAWGLHDMLGNVSEWTCSARGPDYGGQESRCAGLGDGGSERVARGGNWNSLSRGGRSANRIVEVLGNRHHSVGFRVARTLTK